MKFQRYTDVDGGGFNMTPVIDIVFLLIIFFMIVCQFIVAENFSVSVPDDIASGQRSVDQDEKTTTVTVMPSGDGGVSYAVGAEVVASSGGEEISESIAAAIDRQLVNLPEDRRVVGLRVDKGVVFKDSQYAISGISESSATDIKLSVIRQKIGYSN
jgi:biopolymer transport protein ExbD